MSVYLDYNASAPLDERVLDEMIEVYRHFFGNADSRTHDFGDRARNVVENARSEVAAILGIGSNEVFFTSGATESNNIVIQGLKAYGLSSGKKHILTTSIEHKSVLEAARAMGEQGFEVDFVSPDESGRVSVPEILKHLRDDTLLVSMMHVNNETGIIQPVKEVGDLLAERGVLFHVDATQSFGKMVEELKSIQYDMMSMSAHKIGGPQGIGGLILRRKKYKLPPVRGILYGGQQEHGIRPGTVPVALAAGMGKACSIAAVTYQKNQEKCRMVKERMMKLLESSGLEYGLNGDPDFCVPNTMNLYLKGVSSEALMLSSKEYCGISNGSACNSSSYKPSYVLVEMGLPIERIENSIRISWGADENADEIARSFEKLLETAKGLVW